MYCCAVAVNLSSLFGLVRTSRPGVCQALLNDDFIDYSIQNRIDLGGYSGYSEPHDSTVNT